MPDFRYDQSLTDYGTGQVFVESDEKLREAQDEARRKRQREYAKMKRRTDPEWVAKRNKYMREYRRKAPTTKDENPHDPRNPSPHGTPQRYRRHKCRCGPCTMAQRDALRLYRTGNIGPEENMR